MNDCPKCGYPTVWSDDARARICAVYGTHPEHARQGSALVQELAQPVVRRHLKAVG